MITASSRLPKKYPPNVFERLKTVHWFCRIDKETLSWNGEWKVDYMVAQVPTAFSCFMILWQGHGWCGVAIVSLCVCPFRQTNLELKNQKRMNGEMVHFFPKTKYTPFVERQ